MLYQKLRELQEKKNESQVETAKKLNINYRTYNGYLTNKAEPDIETIKILANYFEITTDELLENKKKKNELENITLSDTQKMAIYEILRLNDINLLRAISYCKGLYVNQEEV